MIKEIRNKLEIWGRNNFKPYEWRFKRTPYSVFISEIMLHRTRAEQVVPVYHEFILKYPDMKSVVNDKIENIQKIMKPLGLLWKSASLYQASKIICRDFNCQIPDNKYELMQLPGIADYIASSIICFGYSRYAALIDTNTVRITSRMYNLRLSDSSRRSTEFRRRIEYMVDRKNPVEFNYAILDLGSEICTPKKPSCFICPLNESCLYSKNTA
jgi:A/G-specific adenine glycosylase